jgi:hypothetical protein
MRATTRSRAVGIVLATLGLALTSACAGDSDEATERPTPSCMSSLAPASLPSDGTFPTDWPFPPGTVVTATESVPGGGLAVTAEVGSSFEGVLPFMQHDLEEAGFVATQGEAEHDDAEATWSGNGYSGTWAIKSSETCEGTTLLQVAAAKQ